MLIWVDTLRGVHIIGFLAGRLKCPFYVEWNSLSNVKTFRVRDSSSEMDHTPRVAKAQSSVPFQPLELP